MSRYPAHLPKRYQWHWDHPYRYRARNHPGFRMWLGRHGYLSPNFRVDEARCKHCHQLPKSVKYRARKHAFNLERLRHALGDKPIEIISWYRCPVHNRNIKGALNSRHMKGDATDHPLGWVERNGRDLVNRIANKIWKDGGIGRYPAGSVHFDSRGVIARWTWF